MTTYIALLRAIGGKYSLPSAQFVEILEALQLKDVKTWIATGNAVFRSRPANRSALAKRIRDGVVASRGFAPEVLLLTPDELSAAIANNPYRNAESVPATLHLTFLSAVPSNPDIDKLDALRADGEQFALNGNVFYFHAPGGVGRSKLFARIEKSLGVWGTARNWRTVCKLQEIADAI